MRRNQSSSVWLWSSLDTAVAVAATLLCLAVVYVGPRSVSFSTVLAERLSVKNFLLLTLFLVLWTGIHQLSGFYHNPLNMSWRSLFFRAAFATGLGSVFFLLFPLFSHEHGIPFIKLMVIFFLAAFTGSLIVRSTLFPLFPRIAAAQQQRPLRTLIIGSGPIAQRLFESLNEASRRCLVGFVDTVGSHTFLDKSASLLLGGLDQLERVLMSTAIDEVFIALPLRSCYDEIQMSIRACEQTGVSFSYQCQPFSHKRGFAQVEERALQHYISWHPSRVEHSSLAKRMVDVAGASVALVMLVPIFILIAIAVRLSSSGPLFFTQERYGLNKKRFRMFKFRTMVPDAEALQAQLESRNEAQGPVFKIKNDPRVTRFGRFLRKTSLDELPQFINVLKGDMSLVGPRPLPLRDVAKFNDAWLMRRFSVKPGLTCLWQVQGRSSSSFDQWIALDLKYIDNWTLLLDLKILLLTIPAVVRGSGAF